jgi:hypothetical protein
MRLTLLTIFILFSVIASAQRKRWFPGRGSNEQERVMALDLLKVSDTLQQSIHWPHITPAAFLKNIKRNIEEPYKMSGGSSTNFCGYTAISYSCLKNDPFRYVHCMIDLYRNGIGRYRNIYLHPNDAIKKTAGTMIYQGELDINPADQMWMLSLASRFKGYLNFFNRRYHKGDENTIWASTNLAKFNRMLRKLCKYKVSSRGSDIIRPSRRNLPEFIKEKLQEGEVYLYLNNTVLRKKTHNRMKKRIPTHYVAVLDIQHDNEGMVLLKYWDGSYKTLKELSTNSLKRIVYGISWVKYKERNNE